MAFIPAYILVLFALILIDYFMAIQIEKSSGKNKKLFLVISIISTCFVLFVFKYFNFASYNLSALAELLHWNYPLKTLGIVLPIGLSFHTFQSLSYVIEVYKNKQKAERNLGIYSLYVMFFPQLVAGPIERPQNLLHQFYEKHIFDIQRVSDGLKLMMLGLFKKVVVADRLALFVNQIYDNPTDYNGLSLIMATIFFAFQIYYDFSGYSDIAIGSAQVMGFNLMENFNRPYFSRSIPEFWKRWHISLSTWFKDYLYIPLGGNRVKAARWCFNIFVTFLLSGLWHGANWTFIIWGSLHGFYYMFGHFTQKIRQKFVEITRLYKLPNLQRYFQVAITFCLVCFGWIFFRAKNIKEAFYIITHLFSGVFEGLPVVAKNFSEVVIHKHIGIYFFKLPAYELIVAILSLLFMAFIYFAQKNETDRKLLSKKPLWLRWIVYYAMIFGIIFFGVLTKINFIYFQF